MRGRLQDAVGMATARLRKPESRCIQQAHREVSARNRVTHIHQHMPINGVTHTHTYRQAHSQNMQQQNKHVHKQMNPINTRTYKRTHTHTHTHTHKGCEESQRRKKLQLHTTPRDERDHTKSPYTLTNRKQRKKRMRSRQPPARECPSPRGVAHLRGHLSLPVKPSHHPT
jgi:hypothetical protein